MPYAPRPRCRQCQRRPSAPGKTLCVSCRSLHYGAHYKRLRRVLLQEWTASNGWSCPGWGIPPHLVLDGSLQVDHIVPVNHGGRTEAANLTVLCRRCNISKGDRRVAPPPANSKARSGGR
jgi:5-methylcytosine-specific restriction endonuclease McrA